MSIPIFWGTRVPTWKFWNGTTESALTVQGVWDGTTVQPLSGTITVT